MRIGIDGRLWNETGVGRYVRSLFCYLPELDKENEYVWFLGEKEYHTLAMPSPKWRKVKTNIHWHTFAEQIILPFIFFRENLDLLHFPYFTFPILYSKKFIVTIHDLIFDHYKTGRTSTLPRWFYVVKKVGYHVVSWVSVFRAQKIFTLSQDAKNELMDHYKAHPDKVVVTYESGVLEDARIKSDRPKKYQPYILYVGNAHPHKNVEALTQAIKIIHRVDKKLRLVLVGQDDFFYPKLEKYISRQKAGSLGSLIKVIGSVPNTEIAAWYHFASALVTASKMEGFGIPPLEAMSVGCPAIVSDIPVFHEVYGDAAVYFDQNDPKDVARVILATIRDRKLVAKQVAKGYAQAAKYSWEKMVEETAGIYREVLRDKG